MSQNAISKTGRGGRTKLPRVFTEHGAIMAAMLLNSERAVAMGVYVVRAFVQMRAQVAAHAEILQRLAEMDRTLLEHDESLRALWENLEPLLAPPAEEARTPIGFQVEVGG